MESVTKRHVAVFAFPFSSHSSTLLTLVRRVASAAPTVTFSFFNSAKSNRALFSGDNISGNIRPFDVPDGVPENYAPVGRPEEYINLFIATAEMEFRRCVKVAEVEIGVTIGCLLSDAFLWFAGDIAEEMKVPWVPFRTGGTCALSAHFYTDLIREKVQLQEISNSWNKDDVVDFVPGFSTVRLSDLPTGVVFGDLDAPFPTMLHKMGRILPKSTAVAVNSFQELEPSLTNDLASKLKNLLAIGPLNLVSNKKPASDEFSCIPWLDGQKTRSVAYICFGTVATPPPQELVALAEALDETKTPFLWSIKNDSMKHFPEWFVERTTAEANGTRKIVSWAPQAQVLQHEAIGVFVTHGGWNSVLESVGAGVPMICRPFFGDQQLNTWMVEKVWEIGVRTKVGGFMKNETCRYLEHVLKLDDSSQKIKARILALKELAHQALEPNGSSTQNFNTLVKIVASETL